MAIIVGSEDLRLTSDNASHVRGPAWAKEPSGTPSAGSGPIPELAEQPLLCAVVRKWAPEAAAECLLASRTPDDNGGALASGRRIFKPARRLF